jgi:hypothetical protein
MTTVVAALTYKVTSYDSEGKILGHVMSNDWDHAFHSYRNNPPGPDEYFRVLFDEPVSALLHRRGRRGVVSTRDWVEHESIDADYRPPQRIAAILARA